MYDIITPEIEKEITIDIELKIKRYITEKMVLFFCNSMNVP